MTKVVFDHSLNNHLIQLLKMHHVNLVSYEGIVFDSCKFRYQLIRRFVLVHTNSNDYVEPTNRAGCIILH